MVFDSHSHLDDEAFENDFHEVLKNLKEANIGFLVDPGCDIKTSEKSIELSKKYDFIYSAVGFHPNDIEKLNDKSFERLKELAKEDKVVAIGEIGLDYHYEGFSKEKQINGFIKQIELSKEMNLPFIIHSRDASLDTYNILKEYKDETPCVMHCFSQSLEMAKLYLDLGCYISFSGSLTFKNAKNLVETAKYIPLDKLFIETDAPYLSPEPFRGKRNEPKNVIYVAKKLGEIKNLTQEEIILKTCENAKKFFKIK